MKDISITIRVDELEHHLVPVVSSEFDVFSGVVMLDARNVITNDVRAFIMIIRHVHPGKMNDERSDTDSDVTRV